MDIHNPRALKEEAAHALESAQNPRRIVSVYIGITILMSLLLVVSDMGLTKMISNTTGLSNMGTRAILETIQTALPYVDFLVSMCLSLGFLSAMLHLARRQQPNARALLSGFELFGPILRCTLLQLLIHMCLMLVCTIIGIQIFCMTPLSNPVAEILMPYIESATALSSDIVMDDTVYAALYDSMTPAFVIILVLYAAAAIPIIYRLRMASYCLLDNPRAGGWAAIRQSWRMMKGNCIPVLKLDLRFWGYYVLTLLTLVLCYGDSLLPLIGVELPFSDIVGYFVFYAAYFVAYFALNWFLRLRVETTYALAYESIRPKPQQGGVVLGNIFQM